MTHQEMKKYMIEAFLYASAYSGNNFISVNWKDWHNQSGEIIKTVFSYNIMKTPFINVSFINQDGNMVLEKISEMNTKLYNGMPRPRKNLIKKLLSSMDIRQNFIDYVNNQGLSQEEKEIIFSRMEKAENKIKEVA